MPDDPRSHVSEIVGRPNAQTRRPRLGELPRVEVEGMAEVYARANELWGAALAAIPAGYRIFWGRRREDLAFIDLPADGGRFAILGRHGCCDAVLDGDAELSLRHLLATAIRLDDGTVALRVFDLRGSVPFYLDDEVPRRSIVASGPVVMRLGRYVVGAMPTGEAHGAPLAVAGASPVAAGSATAGPSERLEPFFRTGPAPEAGAAELPPLTTSTGVAPPPRSLRVGGSTHVTLMPPPSEISDVADAAQHSDGAAEPDARPGGARLTVERGGRGASVEVSEADLDAGLLIGRADKCMDRGVRAILTEWVSRAHLLIMRHSGKIHAFDLCSMNGTFRKGSKVRHAILSDGGSVLLLGSATGVELRWHAREAGEG